MDWAKYAWLKRGSRRIDVLTRLQNYKSPVSINDIKKDSKISIPQTSVIIKELLENKLINCLNPKDKIGKLYIINEEGIKLLGEIEK